MGEDGKWFQTIDERYLLPIFSNATASRTFHARRARRSAGPSSITGSAMNTPVDSEDEIDISGQDVESGSPTPGGAGGRPLVTRSISVDESRIERGLRSPVMRSSSGNGSSEGGRYS
jgi:sodium/hydrogen exchanger-like protein 6/7